MTMKSYRANGVLFCGYVYSIPSDVGYVAERTIMQFKTRVMQPWYVIHVLCNIKHHLPGTTVGVLFVVRKLIDLLLWGL